MSCFWCPNWLHISSFRDKAVSHLARLFSMPCKDFPLLRKDVPALLVRRSPHWRAAHTQSRLRPQWEVLQKQEVGDNVWDQRLTWLGESYLWFEMIFWYFLQLLYYIFDYFCITWLEQLHAKEIAKPLPRITYFVPAHSVSEKNELHRYLWPSLVDQLEWSRVVVKWMGLNGSLLLRHVFDSLPLLRRPRWLSRWAAALCAHGGHPHSCRRFVMVTVKWRSALSPKAQKERHVQDRLLRPPHKEMMHPECLGSHRQWNSAWYYIHGISCRAKCVWGGKSNPSGQTINFSLLCPLDWRTRMLLTLDADEQQNDDSICWPGSFLPVIAVRSLLEPTNPTLKIIQERLHDYTIAEAKLVLEPTEQGISRALSKGALLTLTPAIHFYVINVEHGHMLYQMKQRVYTFVLFDQVEPTRSCVAMSTQSMFINIWWQFRRTGNSMNKTPLEQHCFHLFLRASPMCIQSQEMW